MQTAPALYSNASAQFKNDPQQTVTPLSRFSSNVTSATPAKRITFFKSGDPQFSGVRMAIHKRSFKCFDALLDDLSQKVPLPFGVRTITTPRGTHSIKQLEQLEDGGCYLCSDRRYVKPINIEAAGKRPAVWHHHSHTHNTRRRPSRPDEAPNGHHYHRHPKRIILVKNNDPAVRRSITLSRRTARSLRVFMDEISEIMQCHVRKLYTLEGRKIDSIQSLMQCPNVLVCVGKEPFRPLLMESLRKHSDEKLPGVGSRSRSSICSEGHDSKKNVNFGLETKKSIIHPRSDSSNRSTRFSLSSEKSYQNGLCMTPGQTGCLSTCPHTREIIRNDDIEKRVLVNKDGSLSVEMKVRFRLLNDETLQWSTEIKKSAGSLIDGSSVREGDAPYLQGKTEYSDPESTSPYEAEETLATKLHQRQLEESHCQNCCNHCQEYDIWKNPMHKDHGASKSSSSSASSHKVVQEKSSMDSVRTISRSSEEYTEHIVEKASCFQQTVKEGDTKVEYCSISRCCSRSEVCASSLKSKMKQSTEDKCDGSKGKNLSNDSELRLSSAVSDPTQNNPGIFEITDVIAKDTRPISVISNSSKVLELLKEDLDDYDDLPPSVSRASLWSQSDNPGGINQSRCAHCCGSRSSQSYHLTPRPPSKVSLSSVHSSKHKRYKTVSQASQVPAQHEDHADRSALSEVSSSLHSCHCDIKAPGSIASDIQNHVEERDSARSALSKCSQVSRESRKSQKIRRNTPGSDVDFSRNMYEEGVESEERVLSAMSTDTRLSGHSGESSICPHCGGCGRSSLPPSRLSENPKDAEFENAEEEEVKSVGKISVKSCKSVNSARSEKSQTCTHKQSRETSPVSNIPEKGEPDKNKAEEAQGTEDQSVNALSDKTNMSAVTKKSNSPNCPACGTPPDAGSLFLENQDTGALTPSKNEEAEDKPREDVVISAMSDKTDTSVKSRSSHTSKCAEPEQSLTLKSKTPDRDKRSLSPMSARSNSPRVSRKSQLGESERATSVVSALSGNKCDQDPEVISERRSGSAQSNCTQASKKSSSSLKHLCDTPERASYAGILDVNGDCDAEKRKNEPRVSSSLSNKTDTLMKFSGDNSENSKRTSSSLSVRTDASQASKKSTQSRVTSDSAANNDPCQQEIETAPGDRAALSDCTKVSNKSGTSLKHSCIIKEKKATELGEIMNGNALNTDAEPEIRERVFSAMSVKTDKSTSSYRSNKIKNKVSETGGTSQPSASKSPEEHVTQENGDAERANSAMSQNSQGSVKSQVCSESKLQYTSTRAEQDSEEMAQNTLTVITQAAGMSKRAPSSSALKSSNNIASEYDGSNGRASSTKSVCSSMSKKSCKCHCQHNTNSEKSVPQTEIDHVKEAPSERQTSSLSIKSKSSAKSQRSRHSPCPQIEEPLSPTSTASVSIGLGKDHEGTDFNERSTSSMSHTLEESKSRVKMKRAAPDPATSDHIHSSTNPVEPEERPKTATSAISVASEQSRSHYVNSKTHEGSHTEIVTSANSGIKSKLDTNLSDEDDRVPSALSESYSAACCKSPSRVSQSSAKTSVSNKNIVIETVGKNEKVDYDKIDKSSSIISKSSSHHSKSKTENGKNDCKGDCKTMSVVSKNSVKSKDRVSYLNVHVAKRKSGGDSDDGSNKSVKTCTSPAQELNDIEGQAKGPDSLSDSVTSHSLSAADLLRERIGNTRPVSRESKSYVSGKNSTTEQNDKMTFKSDKTSNCKNKKMRASSQNKNEDQFSELIPLALPNASPTEVVKDWLRKIPTDGPMYEMDDEFKENSHDVEPPINAENVTETVQKDSEGASEQVVNIEEPQEEENEESVGDVPKEDNNNAFDETETHTDQPDSDSMHLCRSPKISKREALSKFCHSSVQVMKVLLSPKLDRCNSLPEVSPVYGRKLSTSAKGLLDCLSNLRLIDSDPTNPKDDKYNEIMNILQSLWLCEPVEGMEDKGQKKDLHSAEDEFNPRSSSGVDVGSGSADSGKSSVNDGVEKMEIAQNRIAPIAEQEPPLQEQEEDEDNENKDNHSGASSKRAESSESSHIPSDPATPDIAERVKSSPENEKSDDGVPTSDEMTQSSENPKGETEIDASLSKSSGNDSNVLNTPPATEMTVPEDTNSETSPSVQRAPLTKRVSQDPDPVWVLGLLKKLENQFMTHYANAMAEFKVRWDLEDNEMLDTMIRELKEEVRKRIQTSINRELQKIRSRAGRPPKPPVNTLSRESTAQTELRRRRLKIMHNQSINPSLSRSNYTGSVTDFSDQRSDDEYCPCETCMKKKMASRTVQRAEALCSAPVLMDFDLRKILQMKKDPPLSVPVAPKLEEERSCPNQTRKEENVDLDMVHEEAQEENDEIKNCSSMLIEDHRDASRQDDEHFERKHDTDKGMFSENGTTETEKPTDKATAEKDGDGAEREIVKCENPMEEESAEEERAEDEETIVEKTQDRTEEASGESEAEDGNSEERESVEKEALQNTTKGKKRGGDEEIGDEEKTEEEGVLEGETGGEEEATEQGSINNAHAEGGEMAEGETAKEIGGEGERTTEVTHKEKTADGENVEDKGETEEYEEKEIKEDTVEDRETGKEGEEESDEGGVEVSKEGRANNTSDDRPADGDEMADTVENENPDMDETANEAEEEDTPNKNCVDQNRDTSAEGEDEDDDAGDDEMANTKTENEAVRVCLTETRETNGQEEDSTSSEVREVAKLRDYEEKDGEVAEVEDSETDERQKNDTDGENMDEVVKLGEGEVQETPEKKRANEEDKHTSSDEDAVEESKTENETLDNVLNKQITRTSIESQPGSLEYSKDLTVTAKLQEIHSFMESNESQGENVISTLSHSKEKRNESSRHGRKADKDSTSEVTELQVTSKGRKRLSGRANKQQRPNKGGIRVNDLEF